jgi:hypothetical protein
VLLNTNSGRHEFDLGFFAMFVSEIFNIYLCILLDTVSGDSTLMFELSNRNLSNKKTYNPPKTIVLHDIPPDLLETTPPAEPPQRQKRNYRRRKSSSDATTSGQVSSSREKVGESSSQPDAAATSASSAPFKVPVARPKAKTRIRAGSQTKSTLTRVTDGRFSTLPADTGAILMPSTSGQGGRDVGTGIVSDLVLADEDRLPEGGSGHSYHHIQVPGILSHRQHTKSVTGSKKNNETAASVLGLTPVTHTGNQNQTYSSANSDKDMVLSSIEDVSNISLRGGYDSGGGECDVMLTDDISML